MALTQDDLRAIGALLEPIRADIQEVKRRVTKIEVTLETTIPKRLDSLYEGVQGVQEKFERLDHLEDQADSHDHRIWALEQAVKVK